MNKNRFTHFAAHAVWDRRLTAGDIRVLAALGTYTNEHGFCYPSQKTLAERIGVTPPTVSDSIQKLVKFGYIEKSVRTEKGKGRRGCIYRVRFDQTRKELLDAGADLSPSRIRVQPTSGPAEFGSDREPDSGTAEVGYIEEESQGKNPNTPVAPTFDDLWRMWPKVRASDKKMSRKRWASAIKEATEIQIIAAARLYLASPDATKPDERGRVGGFVKALEAWMNSQLTFWLERVAESDTSTSRRAETPEWFEKLQVRFEDCDYDNDWKTIWSRLLPVDDGNPVVLRAPTMALYRIAASTQDRDRFQYAVGRPVKLLEP